MYNFIHDIAPRRALRARVYRAPFRKGTITTLREPALPRGYFCVGPRDIPGAAVLSYAGYSLPVLAKSEVRYLGEPLLLFCGADPEMLAQIAAGVELSFTEESPVEYKDLSGPYREAQIINLAQGDVDLAFSLAEQIVEGEYRTATQEHCYPDTQGAVAEWDGKSLAVHAATQDPFALKAAVCRCLNIPPRKVRIVAVPMGNTMEGKLLSSFQVGVQAALLSFQAHKPVVLTYEREEDLRFSTKGPQFLIRHQTALDQDGRTLAVRVQIYMDGGCYPPKDCEALHQAVHSAWGEYKVANLEVTGRTLATDFPPIGPYRASGRAQAIFAAELHSSRLQEVSQLDSYTWKIENLEAGGRREVPASALAVLEGATSISDFTRKYAAYSAVKKRRKSIDQGTYPLRGIGLSLAAQDVARQWVWLNGREEERGAWTMKIALDRGRRVRIYTSLVDCGMGIHAMFIQRAAELLDIDAEKISVQTVDTQEVPDTGATNFSRAVTVGLPLLEQCCQALQRKRKSGTPPLEVRRSLPLGPSRPAGGDRTQRGGKRGGRPTEEPSWAATVVEVELDPVTLESVCRGVWVVVEAGQAAKLIGTRGVLEGEIHRALGSSRLPGYSTSPAYGTTYCSNSDLIPGAAELPNIHLDLLASDAADMKSCEQLPHLGVPAAYAAAVCQATGLYIDRIPITAEVIQQCLET